MLGVRSSCWPERADHLKEDRMKTDMAVIMRRLAEVRPVKGHVRSADKGPSAGPGVSRYQRRSANLRDRDCSIDLVTAGDIGLNLTRD